MIPLDQEAVHCKKTYPVRLIAVTMIPEPLHVKSIVATIASTDAGLARTL